MSSLYRDLTVHVNGLSLPPEITPASRKRFRSNGIKVALLISFANVAEPDLPLKRDRPQRIRLVSELVTDFGRGPASVLVFVRLGGTRVRHRLKPFNPEGMQALRRCSRRVGASNLRGSLDPSPALCFLTVIWSRTASVAFV